MVNCYDLIELLLHALHPWLRCSNPLNSVWGLFNRRIYILRKRQTGGVAFTSTSYQKKHLKKHLHLALCFVQFRALLSRPNSEPLLIKDPKVPR